MHGLIIFVDSLRFDAPVNDSFQQIGFTKFRYIPPLGYSANILPLLYRGRTPDELGFYNEYGVGGEDRQKGLSTLDPFVETVGRIPLARKAIYRALRVAGVDAANIPMRLLPYFAHQSTSTYAVGDKHPSVLERLGFHLVLANEVNDKPPARDSAALREALHALREYPRVYLSLNDLDSVSHEWGLNSAEYQRHQDLLGREIHRLVSEFRRLRGASAPVVILSDHGMAPVTATVNPLVEERLGRPGRDRYLYFLDSTMIRLWCADDALRSSIEQMFEEWRPLGRRVTAGERKRWGIESPAVGDYVFVLNEGLIFDPNFIGRGVPLAMHGYHPEVESQHAVFLTNQPGKIQKDVLEGNQAHSALEALFAVG